MTESREHPSGPFEFEAIAVRIGEVEITLHSECGDDLAAGSTGSRVISWQTTIERLRSRQPQSSSANGRIQKIETTPS
jgi:hypothetical protein